MRQSFTCLHTAHISVSLSSLSLRPPPHPSTSSSSRPPPQRQPRRDAAYPRSTAAVYNHRINSFARSCKIKKRRNVLKKRTGLVGFGEDETYQLKQSAIDELHRITCIYGHSAIHVFCRFFLLKTYLMMLLLRSESFSTAWFFAHTAFKKEIINIGGCTHVDLKNVRIII